MAERFVWDYALWGGLGGLVSVLVKCGYLELPRFRDRRLYLGSITGILLGAVAGMIGDSTAVNAFMWGTGGSAIMQGIVSYTERQGAAMCHAKEADHGH